MHIHVLVEWSLLVQFVQYKWNGMTRNFFMYFFSISFSKICYVVFRAIISMLIGGWVMRFNGRFAWMRTRQNSTYVITMLFFLLTDLREPWREHYVIARNPSAIILNFLVSNNKMADVWTCETGAILAPHASFSVQCIVTDLGRT